MKSKIIVLMLSLAACIAIESDLTAATEPTSKQETPVEDSDIEKMPANVQSEIAQSLTIAELESLVITSRTEAYYLRDVLTKRLELIKYWKMGDIIPIGDLHGKNLDAARVLISPKGTIIACVNGKAPIFLWDTDVNTLKKQLLPSDDYFSAAFSPDGEQLAAGTTKNGIISVWNVNTGKQTLKLPATRGGIVCSLAFSPVNKNLLASGSCDSGSDNSIVSLWNLETQDRVKLPGHTHYILSTEFSPNGALIATGSVDGTIRIWDVVKRSTRKVLTPQNSGIIDTVKFSPDGNTLASGSWDRIIRLWDVKNGTEIKQLIGHTNTVRSLVFSYDGTLLISGSWDKTVRIWNSETGKVIKKLTREDGIKNPGDGGVFSVALTPNGKLLAAGYCDGLIRLWQAI